MRHIEVNQLWLQDKVRKGDIEVEKVGGKFNIADALTKHVDGANMRMHIEEMGLKHMSGRHELAPETASEETFSGFTFKA